MGSGLAFCLTPAYREAMARPLRLEFPGALYHVTARGDRREEIVNDNDDRSCLLDISGEALVRFDAVCFAYCLMGNHYHFRSRNTPSQSVAPDASRQRRVHAALQSTS
jgi:REP element-mobilizing transposase RayT